MKLPFTYSWLFARQLRNIKTILDVGCGDGDFMQIINSDRIFHVTGVDLFGPYLDKAKATGAYKQIVAEDVRQLSASAKSYECVTCSQVVEHLKKDESEAMMDAFEKIATKKIIIGVPNGEYIREEAVDGNDLQKHQSSWTPADFQARNYHVYGQSLKLIYGQKGLLYTGAGHLPVVKQLLQIISFVLSPLSYLFPNLGAHLIAVKVIAS